MKSCNVIMYHYVRNLRDSFYPDIKGIETTEFEKHIKLFRKCKFLFGNDVLIKVDFTLDVHYFNNSLPNQKIHYQKSY